MDKQAKKLLSQLQKALSLDGNLSATCENLGRCLKEGHGALSTHLLTSKSSISNLELARESMDAIISKLEDNTLRPREIQTLRETLLSNNVELIPYTIFLLRKFHPEIRIISRVATLLTILSHSNVSRTIIGGEGVVDALATTWRKHLFCLPLIEALCSLSSGHVDNISRAMRHRAITTSLHILTTANTDNGFGVIEATTRFIATCAICLPDNNNVEKYQLVPVLIRIGRRSMTNNKNIVINIVGGLANIADCYIKEGNGYCIGGKKGIRNVIDFITSVWMTYQTDIEVGEVCSWALAAVCTAWEYAKMLVDKKSIDKASTFMKDFVTTKMVREIAGIDENDCVGDSENKQFSRYRKRRSSFKKTETEQVKEDDIEIKEHEIESETETEEGNIKIETDTDVENIGNVTETKDNRNPFFEFSNIDAENSTDKEAEEKEETNETYESSIQISEAIKQPSSPQFTTPPFTRMTRSKSSSKPSITFRQHQQNENDDLVLRSSSRLRTSNRRYPLEDEEVIEENSEHEEAEKEQEEYKMETKKDDDYAENGEREEDSEIEEAEVVPEMTRRSTRSPARRSSKRLSQLSAVRSFGLTPENSFIRTIKPPPSPQSERQPTSSRRMTRSHQEEEEVIPPLLLSFSPSPENLRSLHKSTSSKRRATTSDKQHDDDDNGDEDEDEDEVQFISEKKINKPSSCQRLEPEITPKYLSMDDEDTRTSFDDNQSEHNEKNDFDPVPQMNRSGCAETDVARPGLPERLSRAPSTYISQFRDPACGMKRLNMAMGLLSGIDQRGVKRKAEDDHGERNIKQQRV